MYRMHTLIHLTRWPLLQSGEIEIERGPYSTAETLSQIVAFSQELCTGQHYRNRVTDNLRYIYNNVYA